MPPRKRLGDILQGDGLITDAQLREALEMQRGSGEKLGEALVKLKHVSPEQIADALSQHLRIQRVNLSRRYISHEVAKLVSEEFVRKNSVLPLELIDDTKLTVAMVDPLNIMVIDDLQSMTGYLIDPVIATHAEIEEAFQRTTDISSSARKVFDEFRDVQHETDEPEQEQFLGGAPGVKLANLILEQAVKERASDIHLEAREDDLRVRFRVDGLLRDVMVVPKHLREDVKSRIKIMGNLDITEKRRPQDGRIQLQVDTMTVDMRISTLPTVFGEKIVARVLNRSQNMLVIDQFGFSDVSMRRIERILLQSQGLILVTGPTGSGKTTTLYGFLEHLNDPAKNVITVEDPVEYHLDGVNQVQINPKLGLDFAAGLRTVLRQDPDIIMVGEIRDKETAEISVRSALTGHLVLSTLHTNSAVASIARLLDMGVEPYIMSSTLIGIIAQRLVRRICPDCKEAVPLQDPLIERFIKSQNMKVPEVVYKGKGCPSCKDTGYRRRLAIEEVLLLNKELRDGIDNHLSESELREIALKNGMITLQENAVNKLVSGLTTPAEILRTVYSVDEEEELHE